ncbi:AsmA family protein [Teichococcus aerofrigidensis]
MRQRPRLRRTSWIALALLPLLVLAAAWFGPRLTNWDQHRDRLAILAAGRLGQPVALAGPVSLTLLPQPMLEAGGVTVGGPDAQISVTARALRLRLDWLALLGLRLEPREVALVGAEIRLPWPPAPGQAFRPPPWLTELQGRIQDSRVMLGGITLEQVQASLVAAGPSDALGLRGHFRFRQTEFDFETVLGRAGPDGVAPLNLTLSGAKASLSASGVLLPEGGFEGVAQGGGSDLAALLPAPPGSFRLRGRLSLTAELLTADELNLDIGGSPARGAATLRLAPSPRLDLALATGRVDLDPWIAALRSAGPLPLPFGVDLSAEAASYRGLTLRRLRGAALLENDRLTLRDVGALLPGDTEVSLNGATTTRPGPGRPARLEGWLRFQGTALRTTLLALGLPLEGTDPARLREGEGQLKLLLDEAQLAVSDFTGTLDGGRVSGAGVWRFGGRPALGLGLTFEELRLDGWWPEGAGWAGARQRLAAIDLNLRLNAEHARYGALVLEGLSADASLENGRLTARRIGARMAESDLALSGVVQLGEAPRFTDLAFEVTAPRAAPLMALLPGPWPDGVALGQGALALRLAASGAFEALAVRGNLEFGDLRGEVNGALDLRQPRYAGALTLRHPGAPRLLEEMGLSAPAWLGQGSFSLIANLAAAPRELRAESLDLVAAGLRLGGQLGLDLAAPRPRLTGRLAAERLPLPDPDWRSREPLPLEMLGWLDAELALSAQRLEPATLPPLEQASARLLLRDRVLRLEEMQALLTGGRLAGALELNAAAMPRALDLRLDVSDLALTGPLTGLPIDLTAGQMEAGLRLHATGHSPAAMLATLSGEGQVAVRDGVLRGADLRAAAMAAELPALDQAEAGLRAALLGGATAFEALEAGVRLEAGRILLQDGRLAVGDAAEAVPGGAALAATLSGEFDPARGGMELLLATRPADPPGGSPGGPGFGLRLTGPLNQLRHVPELADWLRWRATR